MVAFYRLFAWYATLESYRMPEPVPSLYFLGVAPFSSGFLLNLLGTTSLPAHDQPNPDQRLFFLANYEYFHFLSVDPCYYGDMHLEHG